MKKLIYFLIMLITACGQIALAQESPPPSQYLKAVNAQFYLDSRDSSVWHFKGATYGWERLGRFKDLRDSVKNVLHSNGYSYQQVNGDLSIGGFVYPQRIKMFGGYTPDFGQISSASIFIGANAADRNRSVSYLTGTVKRFESGVDGAGESNANKGSNYFLNRYNDNGVLIDTVLKINRATGNIDFKGHTIKVDAGTGGAFLGNITTASNGSGYLNIGANIIIAPTYFNTELEFGYGLNWKGNSDVGFHVYDQSTGTKAVGIHSTYMTFDGLSSFATHISAAPPSTANRSIIFPDASGTVALLSDIPSVTEYVPYIGTITDVNIGSHSLILNDGTNTSSVAPGSFLTNGTYKIINPGNQHYAFMTQDNIGLSGNYLNPTNDAFYVNKTSLEWDRLNGSLYTQSLVANSSLNGNSILTLPNKSGTLAVTSDITSVVSSYVPYTEWTGNVTGGNHTITLTDGTNTLLLSPTNINLNTPMSNFSVSSPITHNYTAQTTNGLEIHYNGLPNDDYFIIGRTSMVWARLGGNSYIQTLFANPSLTSQSSITLPDKSGTIALTSDISSMVSGYLPLTGGSMTGDLMLPNTIPTNPLQAVNKNYIDNLITGITWKNAVRVKAIGNVVNTGLQTIDGISLISGDRVLENNQTDPKQNGIWVASSSSWTRSTDADTGDEIGYATVAVTSGIINKNTQWTNTNATIPVIDTDSISFGQISGAGTYINGSGISLAANVFSLDASYARGLFSTNSPLGYNNSTGVLTIQQANSSQPGYLSASDWSVFNGKQSAIALTNTGTGAATFASNILNIPTPSFADPSNLIGLVANNGSSTSFKRADATDAIDQSISPTWTGMHTIRRTTEQLRLAYDASNYMSFTVGSSGALGIGSNLTISGAGSISTNGSLTTARSGFGTTSTDGAILQNFTAATSGSSSQYSSRLHFAGSAWNTSGTPTANSIDWVNELRPTTGATTGGILAWAYSNNGGAYTDRMTLSDNASLSVGGGFGSMSAAAFTSSAFNILTTSTDGVILRNTQSATSSNQVQYSPRVRFTANAWNTSGTPANNQQDAIIELQPTAGSSTSAQLNIAFQNNGGGYSSNYTFGSNGQAWISQRIGIGASGQAPTAQLLLSGNNTSASPFGISQGFGLNIAANTYTSTTTTGTVTNVGANIIQAPTFATSSTTTFTNAATLYIADAPTAGTNVTMSARYALYIASGNTMLANGIAGAQRSQLGISNYTTTSINTTGNNLSILGNSITDGTTAASGNVGVVATNGIAASTYNASNTGVTYSNAATLYIAGSPTAGTNVSITNPFSFYVNSGNSFFGGNIKASQYRLSSLNTAPSSSTDTGVAGEIRYTSSYIYLCTATNTWVRCPFSTF